MTGEKRTEIRMGCQHSVLCVFPYHSTPPCMLVYDCREGHGVIYTECYHPILVSVLFLPVIPAKYLQFTRRRKGEFLN